MDYFKAITGKTKKEATRRPKIEHSLRLLMESAKSRYKLRILGEAENLIPSLSEEQRAAHIHILGTTREGKSKLLELLIRHDIDNGYGCTLLDPSDNGQTALDILKYCCKIGYEKVCLIDPHDHHIAIPKINPLRWRGGTATDSVVQNIMESIRLLWGQTSFSDTPRIETYLSAVLTSLYSAKATIPDGVCYLVKEDPHSRLQRFRILKELPPYDKSRLILEEVFNAEGQQLFLSEFKPSIRRLAPFFDYLPRLIYGSTDSIDFHKLVAEKWVILVNLDKTRLWGTAAQRILGTLVVNELISAISDLRARNWNGRHYLYIDEAGQFATRVLADIMAYKGKSGLWATLSHQFYNQFEDKYVLDAVENLCKIKVLFNTPNSQDRNRMTRDMYTGELKSEAGDNLTNLKKQHAVIKIGKDTPAIFKVSDIPPIDITPKQLEDFKRHIYKSNPWYGSAETIQEEINNRFAIRTTAAGKATKDPEPARGSDEPKGTTGEPSEQPKQGENKAKPKRKSVFDALPDSQSVLRNKKRRPDGKDIPPDPKAGTDL